MRYKRRYDEIEAIVYEGDTNEIKGFLGNENGIRQDLWTFCKPITYLQTSFGIVVLEKGDYVVKDSGLVIVYKEETFNKLFREIEDGKEND